MKRLLVFLLAVTSVTGRLHAQLNVQLQADKDFYVLYEAIPLVVSLHNNSGRTIQLDGTTGQPWLTFLVNEQNGGAIRAVGRINTTQTALIPAGQTVNRTVDIVPLFELRSHGNYRVQAEVNANGISAVSTPVKFTILQGRKLWSQTVGLPSVEGDKDEYRTYALLAHRTERDERLYISVRDDPAQIVYGVVPLGMFLPIFQPYAQIDRDAHLHVIFQNGPRSFAYIEADPRAKIIQRAAFSDYMSRPRLLDDKGVITVTGGEQIYPKMEHILTDAELNPPPPPPPPKKKKSWWPFGKKEKESDMLGDQLPPTQRKR